MADHFGYDHKHGEPNTAHYDEHGHFGAIEDCEGRVIHFAEEPVILDPLSPEEKKRQSIRLTANEKKKLFILPSQVSREVKIKNEPIVINNEQKFEKPQVIAEPEPEPVVQATENVKVDEPNAEEVPTTETEISKVPIA